MDAPYGSLAVATDHLVHANGQWLLSVGENQRTGWLMCDRCGSPGGKTAEAKEDRACGHRKCSRNCIAKGANRVFLDEKTSAVFQISNAAAVKGLEGHHVRIRGTLDERAKNLQVDFVEVLKECDDYSLYPTRE